MLNNEVGFRRRQKTPIADPLPQSIIQPLLSVWQRIVHYTIQIILTLLSPDTDNLRVIVVR
jgi:hypothetical protein